MNEDQNEQRAEKFRLLYRFLKVCQKGRRLSESIRVLISRSDPFGLSRVETFGNSLADSVSFRLPSRLSLDGAPLLRSIPLTAA